MPGGKKELAEQITPELREVEVELGRGKTVLEAVKKIGMMQPKSPGLNPRLTPGIFMGGCCSHAASTRSRTPENVGHDSRDLVHGQRALRDARPRRKKNRLVRVGRVDRAVRSLHE